MALYKKVLLVDDDEDDRAFFLESINGLDQKLVCVIAQNGKEALETLLSDNPKPDIIFLDLNSCDEKVKLEIAKLGAQGFITKPDKFHLWESTLNEFFNGPNFNSQQ